MKEREIKLQFMFSSVGWVAGLCAKPCSSDVCVKESLLLGAEGRLSLDCTQGEIIESGARTTGQFPVFLRVIS